MTGALSRLTKDLTVTTNLHDNVQGMCEFSGEQALCVQSIQTRRQKRAISRNTLFLWAVSETTLTPRIGTAALKEVLCISSATHAKDDRNRGLGDSAGSPPS